jgi:hypothetical protein
MKIAVFWVVAPCSLVEVYQRFRGPCCLHHQGDESLVNFYQTTRCYNPEDGNLYTHRRENLKSYLNRYLEEVELEFLNVRSMRSLNYMHKPNAYKRNHVRPSVCFNSRNSGRILVKFGMNFMPLEAIQTRTLYEDDFWVVAPCSLVEVYPRFRGSCCLHHQGDEQAAL